MKTIDRARVVHEVGATVRLALPLVLAQLAAVGTNVVDACVARLRSKLPGGIVRTVRNVGYRVAV